MAGLLGSEMWLKIFFLFLDCHSGIAPKMNISDPFMVLKWEKNHSNQILIKLTVYDITTMKTIFKYKCKMQSSYCGNRQQVWGTTEVFRSPTYNIIMVQMFLQSKQQ